MRRLILVCSVLVSSAPAQTSLSMGIYRRALPVSDFRNCEGVFSRAKALAGDIRDPAYLMELFPKAQPLRFVPFPSEVTASAAAQWLASHDPKVYPIALFYFANAVYTMRCRDTNGHYTMLTGPFGSSGLPDLRLADGTAEIWHFYFTPNNVAHVFVVTDAPLNALDGPALFAQVEELLNAGHIDLYIRNDPWFFGIAPDPLPYLFTDSFRRIGEQEYRTSQTLRCSTNSSCRLGGSF